MITHTCLIAGSPYGLVFVGVVLVGVVLVLLLVVVVLVVLDEELAGACATVWVGELPPELDPPPEYPEPALLAGACAGAGAGRGLDLTTISGELVGDASPTGAIAAAISTPNASIANTVNAATRGEGSQLGKPPAATGRGSAGPIRAGTALRPRSRMAAISPATSGGSGPRRVPHSTQ